MAGREASLTGVQKAAVFIMQASKERAAAVLRSLREAENELDDVAQMIAAQNELRARRGKPPSTSSPRRRLAS